MQISDLVHSTARRQRLPSGALQTATGRAAEELVTAAAAWETAVGPDANLPVDSHASACCERRRNGILRPAWIVSLWWSQLVVGKLMEVVRRGSLKGHGNMNRQTPSPAHLQPGGYLGRRQAGRRLTAADLHFESAAVSCYGPCRLAGAGRLPRVALFGRAMRLGIPPCLRDPQAGRAVAPASLIRAQRRPGFPRTGLPNARQAADSDLLAFVTTINRPQTSSIYFGQIVQRTG